MVKSKISIALLAAFLFSILFVSSVSAQEANAQAAISSAKDTLKNCYAAVLQAESDGVNVDSLIVTLNDAASSLSSAELFYANGDYDAAYTAASQCQSKLGDFSSQVEALIEEADAAGKQNFFVTLIFSTASLAVFGGGAVVWSVLDKQERRKSHESPAQ